MPGGASLKLGTLFGIRIGAHPTWFLILFLGLYLLSGAFGSYLAALVAAVLFFGSIVLHELGHAVAARREGIGVSGIDLWLFGGVMKMSSDTTSAGSEFRVAAAGPAVTLAIALVAAGAGIGLYGTSEFFGDGLRLREGDTGRALLGFTVDMNLLLLVFNLIPAFPLDGGRIARALVWKLTGDKARATRVAAWLGQGFAWLLIGFGLIVALRGDVFSGLWYAVLGYLLGQSARDAVVHTAVTERLGGVTVADLMDSEPVSIPAEITVERAHEEFFLRYGWPWFAVVEEDGRYVGRLHRAAVEEAVHGGVGELAVRRIAAPEAGDSVPVDATLETLIGSEPLRRLGSLTAVDPQGRLRGVVTREQVARALQSRLAPQQ